MLIKTLNKFQIASFLMIAALIPAAAFSQEKPGSNPQNKRHAGQNEQAPKRAKLVAVLGETDLSKELDEKEARRPARTIPESAKNRTKLELRSGKEAYEMERKVFAIINQKRVESGLSALVWSESMANVARVHSREMAEYNYFSHAGLDGSMVNDRADDLGFSEWKAIGENIAFNQGYENPAEFACDRWMKSTSHYQNIMNKKWKEAGVGVAITKDGRYYFTQVFVLNY